MLCWQGSFPNCERDLIRELRGVTCNGRKFGQEAFVIIFSGQMANEEAAVREHACPQEAASMFSYGCFFVV